MHNGVDKEDFQRDFLKFTAKHFLNWRIQMYKELHALLKVDAKDRKYQVWERNSLSVEIYSRPVF
jgi:putative transposase